MLTSDVLGEVKFSYYGQFCQLAAEKKSYDYGFRKMPFGRRKGGTGIFEESGVKYVLCMKVSRIDKEKRVVEIMVRLYCRHKEGNDCLCTDCSALVEYARYRLERCPFGERKTSCKRCSVHCYKPEMRERMRQVMRFSGPRMLFRHPWIAMKHLLQK